MYENGDLGPIWMDGSFMDHVKMSSFVFPFYIHNILLITSIMLCMLC